MTTEDIKVWLDQNGISMPDFLLTAILGSVDEIEPCMDGAGYPEHTKTMIKLYLITLIAMSQAMRYMSSASSPSGASISYRFTDPKAAFANTLALLRGLDKSGCANDLVPDIDDGPSVGLWVGKGGCMAGRGPARGRCR